MTSEVGSKGSPDAAPGSVAKEGIVTVAVIDSGVHTPHPHLPSVAGGITFDLEGRSS
jgi:hypothetical protein